MSFGFSISDFIGITGLVARAVHTINSNDLKDEFVVPSQHLTELEDAFRTIERVGLDNLELKEVSMLQQAMDLCQGPIEELLDFVEKHNSGPGPPVRKRMTISEWEKLREGLIATIDEKIMPCKLVIQKLAANAERRQSANSSALKIDQSMRPVIQRQNGVRGTDEPLILLDVTSTKLRRPRGCVVIMMMFGGFICVSCFLGVYFTLRKDYGYSMGDSFTLAGYVVAVGAFVSTAVLAYHYPHCRCWERSKGSGKKEDIELLAQWPSLRLNGSSEPRCIYTERDLGDLGSASEWTLN